MAAWLVTKKLNFSSAVVVVGAFVEDVPPAFDAPPVRALVADAPPDVPPVVDAPPVDLAADVDFPAEPPLELLARFELPPKFPVPPRPVLEGPLLSPALVPPVDVRLLVEVRLLEDATTPPVASAVPELALALELLPPVATLPLVELFWEAPPVARVVELVASAPPSLESFADDDVPGVEVRALSSLLHATNTGTTKPMSMNDGRKCMAESFKSSGANRGSRFS